MALGEEMRRREAGNRVRDRGGSPQCRDSGCRGSVRSTTARPEGIAQQWGRRWYVFAVVDHACGERAAEDGEEDHVQSVGVEQRERLERLTVRAGAVALRVRVHRSGDRGPFR